MSDLSPELISQISSRLLHEAQAAAGGGAPELAALLPAMNQQIPHDAPASLASHAASPVASATPMTANIPGLHTLPNSTAVRKLPEQLNLDPLTIPGLAASPGLAAPNQELNPEGLRGFVQRVQSTHWQNPAGLCTEPAVRFPVHGAPTGVSSVNLAGIPASRPLDIPTIRKDFPILHQLVHGKPLVWFDNAATTQKPQSVIDTLSHYYTHDNSNIHRAAHTLAARSTDAYEKARETVQQFLGAGSVNEIIFVRGTTEGINLVAQTYGRKFLQPGDEIILSTLEHHANIVPWQQVAREKGAVIRVIPVNDRGEIMLEEYQSLLGPRTRLVSLTHASNSLGTLVPIQEMIQMAKRYNARVLIDGAQTVAHTPVNVQQLDCDFFVFSGHKIFGPTGIGAVFAKSELQEIMPPWQGGGNMIRHVTFEETTFAGPPAKFEAGTPNIADAVGLGAALEYVTRLGLSNIAKYEHELLEYATHGLSQVPGVRLVGLARDKVGVVSFVLPGKKTEEIGRLLDLEGIAVRAGHHCSQPSLRRFGLDATVRASFAFYNTKQEIDHLVTAIRRIQTA
ncbi:MAG: cysteine desulfurase [Planctomycetes bacterium]|nr:cysteine desulfurase [Planctomycetota bacterium]